MRKLSKIFAVLLTVCLLCGAVVAMTASAAEGESSDALNITGHSLNSVSAMRKAYISGQYNEADGGKIGDLYVGSRNNASLLAEATNEAGDNDYLRWTSGRPWFSHHSTNNHFATLTEGKYVTVDFDFGTDTNYVYDMVLSVTNVTRAHLSDPLSDYKIDPSFKIAGSGSSWTAQPAATLTNPTAKVTSVPISSEVGVFNHATFVLYDDGTDTTAHIFINGTFLCTYVYTGVTGQSASCIAFSKGGVSDLSAGAGTLMFDNTAWNFYTETFLADVEYGIDDYITSGDYTTNNLSTVEETILYVPAEPEEPEAPVIPGDPALNITGSKFNSHSNFEFDSESLPTSSFVSTSLTDSGYYLRSLPGSWSSVTFVEGTDNKYIKLTSDSGYVNHGGVAGNGDLPLTNAAKYVTVDFDFGTEDTYTTGNGVMVFLRANKASGLSGSYSGTNVNFRIKGNKVIADTAAFANTNVDNTNTYELSTEPGLLNHATFVICDDGTDTKAYLFINGEYLFGWNMASKTGKDIQTLATYGLSNGSLILDNVAWNFYSEGFLAGVEYGIDDYISSEDYKSNNLSTVDSVVYQVVEEPETPVYVAINGSGEYTPSDAAAALKSGDVLAPTGSISGFAPARLVKSFMVECAEGITFALDATNAAYYDVSTSTSEGTTTYLFTIKYSALTSNVDSYLNITGDANNSWNAMRKLYISGQYNEADGGTNNGHYIGNRVNASNFAEASNAAGDNDYLRWAQNHSYFVHGGADANHALTNGKYVTIDFDFGTDSNYVSGMQMYIANGKGSALSGVSYADGVIPGFEIASVNGGWVVKPFDALGGVVDGADNTVKISGEAGIFEHVTFVMHDNETDTTAYVFINGEYLCKFVYTGKTGANAAAIATAVGGTGGLTAGDGSMMLDNTAWNFYSESFLADVTYGIDDYITSGAYTTSNLSTVDSVVFDSDYIASSGWVSTNGGKDIEFFGAAIDEALASLENGGTITATRSITGFAPAVDSFNFQGKDGATISGFVGPYIAVDAGDGLYNCSKVNIGQYQANVSLFTDMTFNLYLPKISGITYTGIIGASELAEYDDNYFVTSWKPFVNDFGAQVVVINYSYELAGVTYEFSVKVTLDVVRYAILVAESDEYACGSDELALVYEMMNYKVAVATYVDESFDKTSVPSLVEFYALIDAHTDCACKNTVAPEAEDATVSGISVGYVIDDLGMLGMIIEAASEPTVSFVNPDGVTVYATVEESEEAGTYIVSGISAAYIDNVMTISVDGATGTYSLAYYAANCGDAKVAAVANALLKYAVAAENYKVID